MTGKKARPDPWPAMLRYWLDETEARIQVALQEGRSQVTTLYARHGEAET